MNIFRIDAQGMQRVAPEEGLAQSGDCLWIDVERGEANWRDQVRAMTGVAIYEHHMSDLANDRHPPFYDGSEAYDLLVARALDAASPPDAPRTHAVAFVITADAIISVRPPADPLFDGLRDRLLNGQVRMPTGSAGLLYLLLNPLADALLQIRQPMTDNLAELQARLLDPRDSFDHWQRLMDMRSRYRWLETNVSVQREVLDAWREQTSVVALDEAMRVRFNDIDDHLARVERHARGLEADVSTLVQVHFSASSDRNNRVIQFLAVVSVIFLPLNLLASLFGMNFHRMPLLAAPWGFWGLVAGMLAICAGLLSWFRWRRWI